MSSKRSRESIGPGGSETRGYKLLGYQVDIGSAPRFKLQGLEEGDRGRVMSRTGPTMAADSKQQTPIASFQSMKSGSKRLLDYHISVIALLLWYYTHQSAVEVTDVSVLFPFACTSWNHSDGRICSSFSSIKQPSGFELHRGSASLPSFTRYYWIEYLGCAINNPGFLYAIGCKFCVSFPGLSS